MSKSFDPVSAFNARIPQVTSRFAFDRPWRIVGQADIGDSDARAVDRDIYSGTVITPQGFARLAYHHPTQTICLLVSKTATNLRGSRQKDGRILATYDGMAKSYLVAARRSSTDPTEFRINAQDMRGKLHRFCTEMDERTRKHFTLFSGSTSRTGSDAPCEIYTNGRLAYTLSAAQPDQHRIRFHAPTRRQNGSFIPVELDEKNFWQRVISPNSSIIKTIASAENYADSRDALARHWQKVSSRLWDEKSIYADEGMGFTVGKHIADMQNSILVEHRKSIAISGAVGLGVAVETHQVGLGIAAFAMGHIAAHYLLERGADGTKHVAQLLKKARQRRDIESYPADAEDVSDYFKVKTKTNIAKLCPHIDLNDIDPRDFEFIQSDSLLPDHDIREDGMQPASLRGHLLSAHQRGFSSNCSLPDPATRVDVFQSGLVRLLHEGEKGDITIYATYRPEACVSAPQRLPENYIEAFDGKFVRIEYDRRNPRFADAFRSQDLVTYEAMAEEVGSKLLFNQSAGITDDVKKKSLESVLQTFRAPDPDNIRPKLYMGGQPPRLPDIAAIL